MAIVRITALLPRGRPCKRTERGIPASLSAQGDF